MYYIVASHKASQVTGKDILGGWVKSKKKITAVQKPTAFFSRNCLSIISANVSRSWAHTSPSDSGGHVALAPFGMFFSVCLKEGKLLFFALVFEPQLAVLQGYS